MIDVIFAGLVRSTFAVIVAAGFAWLLLTALRPRSPGVHRVVWMIVLLQAACWKPIGLAVLPAANAETAKTETAASLFPDEPVRSSLVDEALPATGGAISTVAEPPTSSESIAKPARSWRWKPVLVGAWVVGAALLLLVGVGDYLRLLRRLHHESAAAPADWRRDWEALPHGRATLVATDTLGPLAIRTPRQSVVAMPRAFGDSMSPAQRRAVLAHEIGHLRSGDPFWMLLVWLATAAQWFNPFAWLAARRFHAAAELACDDRLEEEVRLPLAQVLLTLAQPDRRAVLAMTGGALAARIRALATPKEKDSMWKPLVAALLVLATCSAGWIRLEAAQPPSDEPKKVRRTEPPPAVDPAAEAAKRNREEQEFEKLVQATKRGAGKQASRKRKDAKPDEPLPQAIEKAEAQLKRLEAEKKEGRAAVVKALNDREMRVTELKRLEKEKKVVPPDAVKEVEKDNERINDVQSAFQRKSAEYDQLRRNTEAMKQDLDNQRQRTELLWVRMLRQPIPDEDDALALERTLSYLATREPMFGRNELLTYLEHVETEAVQKLETLLKRNIKPQPGETWRQTLDRVLQSPPTEQRQRYHEASENLTKSGLLSFSRWEDHRDRWLGLIADLFESMNKGTLQDVWPVRFVGRPATPDVWIAVCCDQAALRARPSEKGDANARALDEWISSVASFLPDLVLTVETFAKGNCTGDFKTWARLHEEVLKPQVEPKHPRSGDLRRSAYVNERLFALLEAAKKSPAQASAANELRKRLDRQEYPAEGLDRLMELEGQRPFMRERFFQGRKIAVNFQGRGFANAFEELRGMAALPLVPWANVISDLRPITLHAEASWIDVMTEVCRQVGLEVQGTSGPLVICRPGDPVVERIRSALQRLPSSPRRADVLPGSPKVKAALAGPTTMEFRETPLAPALMFLGTQHDAPIVMLPSREIDRDTPVTMSGMTKVPFGVALELLMAPLHYTWTPVYDAIVLVPASRRPEFETKASAFREERKRLQAAAAAGDPSAAALMSPTVIEFTGTPLKEGVAFIKTQHGNALQLELRTAKPDREASLQVSNVPLAEALELLAWSNNLKLTFEGNKAVLSDP